MPPLANAEAIPFGGSLACSRILTVTTGNHCLLWLSSPAWLLLVAAQVPAQTTHRPTPTPANHSAFTLVSVKVTGSQRYPAEAVVAAGGLRTGEAVSESDFQAASARLAETGAFSSVNYSYQYSPAGAKLVLEVVDSDHFVPARFENIVWFSEPELLDKLRARVPLFLGQLPLEGKLPDQVSDALQTLLDENNVQGRADYLRAGDNDRIDAIVYSVSGVTIRIRKTEFTGAGSAEMPLLEAAGAKLEGQDYLRSLLRTQADKEFLPVYRARGYLKASFSDGSAKVVDQSPQETDVEVRFTVDPGPRYQVADIQVAGSKALPADKLRELIHQKPGQPADAVALGSDVEAMKKLYGTLGYMAAAIQVVPTLDDAHATVRYQIRVDDGDLFHMGDLEIQGLDPHETVRVTAKWTLAKNDSYDSSYPRRFVKEVLKTVLVDGEWNISIHEMPEAADKTVDVNVKFERKATL
jgi:outer membrane protein assembly factor BamA